jgi:flagellar biosynthesis/type III secretory pathway protein FliH
MTDKKEYWAGLTTARRRGETEGFAKGEAKGEAKGLAKGEAKGKAKMAKFLRAKGVSAKLLAAALAMKD